MRVPSRRREPEDRWAIELLAALPADLEAADGIELAWELLRFLAADGASAYEAAAFHERATAALERHGGGVEGLREAWSILVAKALLVPQPERPGWFALAADAGALVTAPDGAARFAA